MERERDRQRDRETERQTDRQRQRERQRARQTDRQTDRERQTDTHRESERCTQTDEQTGRQRANREIGKYTETETRERKLWDKWSARIGCPTLARSRHPVTPTAVGELSLASMDPSVNGKLRSAKEKAKASPGSSNLLLRPLSTQDPLRIWLPHCSAGSDLRPAHRATKGEGETRFDTPLVPCYMQALGRVGTSQRALNRNSRRRCPPLVAFFVQTVCCVSRWRCCCSRLIWRLRARIMWTRKRTSARARAEPRSSPG